MADAKPADFNLAENAMRYLVHTPPRPDYDDTTFDFDRDAALLEAWGKLANANNPDLSKFRRPRRDDRPHQLGGEGQGA
jgi:hypothetical protein